MNADVDGQPFCVLRAKAAVALGLETAASSSEIERQPPYGKAEVPRSPGSCDSRKLNQRRIIALSHKRRPRRDHPAERAFS